MTICEHCAKRDHEFRHLKARKTGAWEFRNQHGHWADCPTLAMTRYHDEHYWTTEYDCDGYECAAKIEITYRATVVIEGMSDAARSRLEDVLLEKAMLAIGWLKRAKEFFCVECQKEDRLPK